MKPMDVFPEKTVHAVVHMCTHICTRACTHTRAQTCKHTDALWAISGGHRNSPAAVHGSSRPLWALIKTLSLLSPGPLQCISHLTDLLVFSGLTPWVSARKSQPQERLSLTISSTHFSNPLPSIPTCSVTYPVLFF